MKIKLLLIFIFIIIFNSCEQENVTLNNSNLDDYRSKYCGVFDFIKLHNTVTMIDTGGWNYSKFDSSFYSGKVTMIDTNRIKIEFDTIDFLNDVYGKNILKVHYPILSEGGHIQYPEFLMGGHQGIKVYKFIGYDSLIIKFNYGGLVGGYEIYYIVGKRKEM
jgi:hypothetical protein